jgi:general secretion pathway protein E
MARAIADDPAGPFPTEAFAAHLVASGAADAPTVERARRAAEASGERLDTVLVRLGLLGESALAEALGAFLGLPLLAAEHLPPAAILPDLLPARFVRRNRVLPVRLEAHALTLAVVDPFDATAIGSVRLAADRKVALLVASAAEIERAAARLYGGEAASASAPAPAAEVSEEAVDSDLRSLQESASEALVIRLVNQIVEEAVDAGASDVYVEPTSEGVVVRLRVDGLLRVRHELPARLRAPLISRLKILARLDIAERRLPQDGRVKLPVRGAPVDLRVATIPTIDGEAMTLRILDRSRVALDFATLGYDEAQIETLARLTDRRNGMVLVTGPTGSGKTTTLYAALRRLSRPTVKIFTVEDPIEYQIAGVSQVQVQPAIDLDFPACLRSILRHHPDMIMIGEIRDVETARIAVQASLTGHLVLSTLHTNSAAESLTRLLDMGVERFMLGSTLRGVVAQRLVRRLCPHCSRPRSDAPAVAAHLRATHPGLACFPPGDLREPVGCVRCQEVGYAGQIAIAEILEIDDAARGLVLAGRPAEAVEAQARAAGIPSLFADGLAKAARGLTSIEEVMRVASPG